MHMLKIDLVGLLIPVCLLRHGFEETHIDGPALSLGARFKRYEEEGCSDFDF